MLAKLEAIIRTQMDSLCLLPIEALRVFPFGDLESPALVVGLSSFWGLLICEWCFDLLQSTPGPPKKKAHP